MALNKRRREAAEARLQASEAELVELRAKCRRLENAAPNQGQATPAALKKQVGALQASLRSQIKPKLKTSYDFGVGTMDSLSVRLPNVTAEQFSQLVGVDLHTVRAMPLPLEMTVPAGPRIIGMIGKQVQKHYRPGGMTAEVADDESAKVNWCKNGTMKINLAYRQLIEGCG